jgi:hypothetical protein
MAKPRMHLVSATPGVLGRTVQGGELFDAIEIAARARTAGYEGKIFTVFDDNTIQEFVLATKAWSGVIPNPFGP